MPQTSLRGFKLNNGVEIPSLGLGVFRSPAGRQTQDAVQCALDAGYRLFDTAALYDNEADVGQALEASNIARQDVFITTKLWNQNQGYEATLRAFEASMRLMGLEQLDLYLIHWPVPGLRRDSWRALETLYREGHCRAIGVSNYTIRHLEELFSYAQVSPSVNQVEFHPFLYQAELLAFCRRHGIQLEAYSPLVKAKKMSDPVISRIATKHDRTPAQILIRWGLQHEVVVIPKSIHCKRIIENGKVFDFELDPSDMAALDGLDQDLRTSWDPTEAP